MPSEPRQAITLARRAMEQWERDERDRLLADHREEFRQRRVALYADCEAAGGHEWYDMPDNGVNRPHFVTREWPQACRWCGMSRPITPEPPHAS